MKVVTIGNCDLYWVCFVGGFVKNDYVWSVIVDSLITSYYGPVIVTTTTATHNYITSTNHVS